MGTLRIDAVGRTWTLEEGQVATVGRDLGSTVVLDGPTVSRHHAEIRYDGAAWVIVDRGSSSGTYLNGVRVTDIRITGRTSVRFGSADGLELVALPEGAENRPAAPGPGALPPPGLAQTVVPHTGPAGPGYVSGPGLLVRVGGQPHRFPPGTVVRIGRDPGNEVVVDDPSVSRLHAVVEGRPDGWWYVDRSTAGSFDAEDRVTQRRLEEPTTLMLGHPTAGAEIEVVPVVDAGKAQKSLAAKKRRRTLAVVGAAVAALVLVGGGVAAAVLLGGDDEPEKDDPPTAGGPNTLTSEELELAKAATVQVWNVDESGQGQGWGSGAIISDDGLVITNAHVADPNAPGQDPYADDPVSIVISLTGDDDDPAEPTYTAELLVSDGVLDVALLQITGDLEGKEIDADDLDLPEPLPLGDSDELQTDDEIRALGFPALASIRSDLSSPDNPSLTVTRGVVSTFLTEDAIDDPRAWIDTDARIAGGNSGGPSINIDGELIGLNTQAFGDNLMGQAGPTSGGSGRIRPVKLLQDVIDIARDGGDPSYVSPYFEGDPEPEPAQGEASIAPTGWSTDGSGDCATPTTPDSPQSLAVALPATLYAHFLGVGIPDGTPLEVQFTTFDGASVGEASGAWGLGTGEVCANVSVDVPEDVSGGLIATLTIGDAVVENAVVFE
ncbi:FHA domain-containing protein [Nocardioides caeni]|uniref:FHA domain-containing protein n=1 Tax=Nocardioides caeni TaxID=574700 RepID=A0A4S8N2F3_9ACTN|nr:FHA domain-containing protein [Nocardioides caeni]THV10097.1 FHA domain-containing protein [Nocardioides caeni]